MRAQPPNEYRYNSPSGAFNSTDADGMNGAFAILLKGFGHKLTAYCIVSDGYDPVLPQPWEHVSVHMIEYRIARIPTWSEMCTVKDIFWEEEELVVQFHPPKSEYVNTHPYVLHLWKSKNNAIASPPKICV